MRNNYIEIPAGFCLAASAEQLQLMFTYTAQNTYDKYIDFLPTVVLSASGEGKIVEGLRLSVSEGCFFNLMSTTRGRFFWAGSNDTVA